jgi:hypothetical protein
MPQRLPRSWQRRLLLGLSLVLAVEFILGGAAKFYPGDTFFGPSYAVKFVGLATRPGSASWSAPESCSAPPCWLSRARGLWAPRSWWSS